MRFEEIYGSYRTGRLSCEKAAEILSISLVCDIDVFYVDINFHKRQRLRVEIGKDKVRRALIAKFYKSYWLIYGLVVF